MQVKENINIEQLPIINPLVKDYLSHYEKVKQLWNYPPNLKAIETVLNEKKQFPFRKELQEVLNKQFKGISLSNLQLQNIESLKENNTFTVCTAHQLCLFTGPSYFIYKIISVIKTCKFLKEKYPKNNFIPIYWMGSEDHDFEEINHCYVYGKKVEWHNDETGAVGRKSNKGINKAIEDLSEILGSNEQEKTFIEELKQFFPESGNYGTSFQQWIMHLFKEEGLLVINQDDVQLKTLFSSVIKEELEQQASETALQNNLSFLETNYHVQAQGRPINLFYHHNSKRQRIEKQNNNYSLSESNETISQSQLLNDVGNISPNVILRPLYQETCLPNVAYIGGPGEVSYWLQLKDVFAHYKVKMPLLLLRDMALIFPKNQLQKLQDWKLQITDLFRNYDEVAKELVAHFTEHELSLHEDKIALEKLFTQIKDKAVQIDKSMDKSVEAELQKTLNSFANLESKLMRAEKRNHELQLKQLENIFSKTFPNGTFQERHDSFIPVYLKNRDSFVQLEHHFNAFNNTLKVFEL
ncbi:MAG: bacillithiol biosynthesis cysteine-adding enzyme BshC [Chitinophagales bacterium]|nr:bacillithiol biosynthesis cysteine-adding enzyme BshC [Chitinophagales bacterium]